MAIYDPYVPRIADYVEQLRQNGRQVRDIDCPSEVSKLLQGLPVRVGPGASSGLILRGDTFVELGNPEAGSCSFVLWTDTPRLVRDGRIALIGPDIPESPGASLPFGQVLMVGGAGLSEADHDKLEQSQYVADQVEGYMVRSVSQLIWSRVSKEAAEKGFCFETLGRALMAIFRTTVPGIQAMEIIFTTSAREDLQPLDDIGEQVRKIAKNIVVNNWKARGYDLYECTLGWDCNACPDRPVCDEIKEVINVRKTQRSTTAPDAGS